METRFQPPKTDTRTLTFYIVETDSKPFTDAGILDACVDPQFNGVFPDDPGLGIVSERKANARISANPRTTEHSRRGEDHQTEHNDSC